MRCLLSMEKKPAVFQPLWEKYRWKFMKGVRLKLLASPLRQLGCTLTEGLFGFVE